MTARVAVVGAAGYIGGDLIRILLGHPQVELAAATSRRLAGRRVDGAHPNLRGLTDLTFLDPDRLGRYDVLFTALPHRESMRDPLRWAGLADLWIDLAGDFRLRDPAVFAAYYGVEHATRTRSRGSPPACPSCTARSWPPARTGSACPAAWPPPRSWPCTLRPPKAC